MEGSEIRQRPQSSPNGFRVCKKAIPNQRQAYRHRKNAMDFRKKKNNTMNSVICYGKIFSMEGRYDITSISSLSKPQQCLSKTILVEQSRRATNQK